MRYLLDSNIANRNIYVFHVTMRKIPPGVLFLFIRAVLLLHFTFMDVGSFSFSFLARYPRLHLNTIGTAMVIMKTPTN